MAKVDVSVTVVKRTTSQSTILMQVDENEDQWTTFENARKRVDEKKDWTVIDEYTDRFHSQVVVLD